MPDAVVAFTSELEVRQSPGENAPLLEVITPETPLAVLGRANSYAWYKVQTPSGTIGWTDSRYVHLNIDFAAIPILEAFIPAGSSNADWTPVVEEYNGIPFVKVPAGCFMMGSEDGEDDEKSVHEVCLSEFWIGQTEVTNAQYKRCVAENKCTPPYDTEYHDNPFSMEQPVVHMTWDQANELAEWLGGALPSEAQWEYTARGPEAWVYPWGEWGVMH